MSAVMTLPDGIIQRGIHTPERWEQGLARREVFELVAALPLSVSCLDGVLWVTLDGDAADHVLSPGQSLALARGVRAVIQAIRPGRFAVRRH